MTAAPAADLAANDPPGSVAPAMIEHATPPLAAGAAGGPSTTFLDGLRGLAALYVCIRHSAQYLYGYPAPGEKAGLFERGVMFGLKLFSQPHAAVIFFFVLSGFVIHLRYSQRLQSEGPAARFGWGRYAWRRIRRLYPPLLLALALTFAVDRLGMWLGFPIYRDESGQGLIHLVYTPDHSWRTLAGNLAFLVNVNRTPAWGTDAPLWTLTYEWWFYMAYPLFWWLTKRSIAASTAAVAAVFAATRFLPSDQPLFHLPLMIFGAFPIWWAGALLADVYTGRLRVPYLFLAPLLLLLPFSLQGATGHPNVYKDITLGLSFAGLIALCFDLKRRGFTLRPLNALKWLGDCSYTLYLIHLPLVVFASGWIMSRTPGRWLPRHPWALAATVAAVVVLSYAAHLVVERPFTGTRRRSAKPHPAVAGGGTPRYRP